MLKYLTLVGVVVIGLLGISRVGSHDAQRQSLPPSPERPTAGVRTGDSEEQATAAAYLAAAQQVTDYYEGLERERQIREYLAAEADRLAAEEAARVAAARTAPGVTPAGGGAGGDCGPVAAIVGWGIVMRESGGNPNAQNASSGAYGCSQTLPSHYRPGGVCEGLDMYTVAGQTECTQRLYDRGGLRPWGG